MPYYFGRGITAESPGNAFTAAYDAAQLKQKQSKLADLLANAYGTQDQAQRQGYITDAIRTDPAQGMTLAKLLDPRLSGSGGKPAQQQYAEWLLSQVPEDKRGHTLGYLAGYENRPSGAAIKYDEIVGEDGIKRAVAFDPRQPGAQVVGMQPGVDQRQPEALGGQLFAGLGQIPGIQVTSGLRTPERNAQVGGVPNSYHLTGQARDISPPSTMQAAQQVRQYAAQNGLEIIDEGDHWHLEPAPRRGAQRGAPNPFQSRPQEQQKYLDERAQQRAQIDTLAQRGQIEAQNAAARERAVADAKPAMTPFQQAQLQMKAGKAKSALSGTVADLDRMSAAVNKVLRAPGLGRITGVMGAIPDIPGSDAANARADLESLKSQIGFAVLQKMRSMSPTGGALGSVSDAEGRRLEANLASLDTVQSEPQLRERLRDILDYVQSSKSNLSDAYNEQFGELHQPKQPASGGRRSAPPALPAGFTWSND